MLKLTLALIVLAIARTCWVADANLRFWSDIDTKELLGEDTDRELEESPTGFPTFPPTSSPSTKRPTRRPSKNPSRRPTKKPTKRPTKKPTKRPTKRPTSAPTQGIDFPTTPSPTMPPIPEQWKDAHNFRRTLFYSRYNLTAKDLKWSPSLAADAQSYANSLLSLVNCTVRYSGGGRGENLNAYYGYDHPNMTFKTPEEVTQSWYGERFLPLGANLEFLQVIWRGSSYLGCGRASKSFPGNGLCFISVCRYVAPGLCRINRTNYLDKALADTSPCLPACPSEGCF